MCRSQAGRAIHEVDEMCGHFYTTYIFSRTDLSYTCLFFSLLKYYIICLVGVQLKSFASVSTSLLLFGSADFNFSINHYLGERIVRWMMWPVWCSTNEVVEESS